MANKNDERQQKALKLLFPDVIDIITNNELFEVAKKLVFENNIKVKLKFEKYGI